VTENGLWFLIASYLDCISLLQINQKLVCASIL